MSTTQAPYVFISYAHAHEPLVQRLTYDLKMRGMNAWVDKAGLVAGEPDWENALRVAISGASQRIFEPTRRTTSALSMPAIVELNATALSEVVS